MTPSKGATNTGGSTMSLFFYTKSEEWTWNPIYSEYDPEYINNFYKYTEPENKPKVPSGRFNRTRWRLKGKSTLRIDGCHTILATQLWKE